MKWKFHPAAAEEFWAACRHYAEIDPRLGQAFLQTVEDVLDLIGRHPEASVALEGDVRRHPLRRFPFSVYFSLEAGQILVLAVMHMKRRPDYWRDRQG